ncbi:hypothetical protein ACUNV4_20875 [Granulosicoccus sp. 3-233]|uniref:hypothetical protein n=1 Tax=Granulosicoccus sp. 3-233 TaxID=3417969 RepID=UPI003D33E735
MNPVIISTEALKREPRELAQSGSIQSAFTTRTRFQDLPLPARLLLAVPRARGRTPKASIAARYVLDTLGRIIDAGAERQHTIEAVNLLAEILLNSPGRPEQPDGTASQWLSDNENLVLCLLCKIHAGQAEEARNLARHCLAAPSIEPFSKAATALCSAECFRRGGEHVFTPSWRGMPEHNGPLESRSVTLTSDLSLGEAVLLNALRLRKRTLSYVGLGAQVVPLLCHHVALPELQSVVDAVLVESIRYSAQPPAIQCLCCPDISAFEAMFLGTLADFSTGDTQRAQRQLSEWLPSDSVDRLMTRSTEFQAILSQIGTALPNRQWDIRELRARESLHRDCEHFNETPMIH